MQSGEMFPWWKGNEELWSSRENETTIQGGSFEKILIVSEWMLFVINIDLVHINREKPLRQCYRFKRIKGKRNRRETKKKEKEENIK